MNGTIFMVVGFTLLFVYMAIQITKELQDQKKKKNVNRNGRVYTADVIQDTIQKFNESNKHISFAGEIEHPGSTPAEIITHPVIKIQSVACPKKRFSIFSRIFKREKMNKDVKRVMDALDSSNIIVAHTGQLDSDKINFACSISKDNEDD